MKYAKINFVVLISVIQLSVSCAPKPVEEKSIMNVSEVILPEIFSYQGRNPEMGKSEILDYMIKWNQYRADLDHKVGSLLADTVILHLADGRNLVFEKSAAEEFLREQYNSIASQKVTINAGIPVHYNDIDHTWIYSWIFLESEDSKGEYTSEYFHEDFRIIDDKIREIFQFRRDPGNDY